MGTLALKHPRAALFSCAVLLAASLFAGRGLETEASMRAFVPLRDPRARTLAAFERIFPAEPALVVEPPVPDRASAQQVRRRLDRIEGADRVEVVEGARGGFGVVVSTHARSARDRARLVAAVREAAGPEASVAGPLAIEADIDRATRSSLARLSIGALALSFAAAALGLGSAAWAAAALLGSLVAAAASLLVLRALAAPLDLLTSSLPAVAGVLALSSGIHLLWARREVSGPAPTAWRRALALRWRPLVVAAATTAAGFAALAGAPLPPLARFGTAAALSVLLGLAVQALFLPALGAIFDRRSWTRPGRPRLHLPPRRFVLLAAGAATVCALVFLPRLRVESDVLSFFPDDHPLVASTRRIERDLFGLTPLEVWLRAPRERADDAALHAAVARFVARAFEIGEGDVTRVLGPDLGAVGRGIVGESGGDDRLVYEDGTVHARLTFLLRTTPIGRTAALLQRIESALPRDAEGLDVALTGPVPLIVEVQHLLPRAQARSLLLSFAGVSLALFALLRSWRLLWLAWIPNVLPVVWLLGAMGAFGLALDVATVTVAGIAFGIVVDDTCHLLWGYARGRRRGRRDAAAQAAARLRRPLVTTSAALSAGFAAFALSPFRPTAIFGALVAAAAGAALLCDLFVLPALLEGGAA